MSNIDKRALREAAERAKDNFIPCFRAPTRDVLALLDELEAKDRRIARALSLLSDANTENVWDVIGRLKVVIGGDYRSEAEIAAAAKGE
ncbi:hypothetical protein R9C62_002719 [Enterobacter hormaechei]|nr:hypothetical protein [Enterobacter hormaechei]